MNEREKQILIEKLEQLRRTKGALALSEARFQNMIEKDGDGIIIVDSNGVGRFFNPAAAALNLDLGPLGTLL